MPYIQTSARVPCNGTTLSLDSGTTLSLQNTNDAITCRNTNEHDSWTEEHNPLRLYIINRTSNFKANALFTGPLSLERCTKITVGDSIALAHPSSATPLEGEPHLREPRFVQPMDVWLFASVFTCRRSGSGTRRAVTSANPAEPRHVSCIRHMTLNTFHSGAFLISQWRTSYTSNTRKCTGATRYRTCAHKLAPCDPNTRTVLCSTAQCREEHKLLSDRNAKLAQLPQRGRQRRVLCATCRYAPSKAVGRTAQRGAQAAQCRAVAHERGLQLRWPACGQCGPHSCHRGPQRHAPQASHRTKRCECH